MKRDIYGRNECCFVCAFGSNSSVSTSAVSKDNMIYPIRRVKSTSQKGIAKAAETFIRVRLKMNLFPQVTQYALNCTELNVYSRPVLSRRSLCPLQPAVQTHYNSFPPWTKLLISNNVPRSATYKFWHLVTMVKSQVTVGRCNRFRCYVTMTCYGGTKHHTVKHC
jgi:hypothetical protein